jgi:hypothetical protein
MIFPRGEVKYRNLLTAFADLSALLSVLKGEGFSGILEAEFPENRGLFFIDSGEVINAEAKAGADSKRMTGSGAVRHLLGLSKQKDGVLNVYKLSPEQVAIVAGNLDYEAVFRGLSTEFIRLDRLLLKLKEEKHDGFIEICTKGDDPRGVLFLQDGEPAEMFTLLESGSTVSGRNSIDAFAEQAAKEELFLNLYRSHGMRPQEEMKAPEKGNGLRELLPVVQEVLSRVERLVDEGPRKGVFGRIFTASLIEKSEQFPFLDPFGGDLHYRDGDLEFAGEAEGKDFFRGIEESLKLVLRLFEKEFPKDRLLLLKLKEEIDLTLETHLEVIKRSGVNSLFRPAFK